MLIIAVKYSNLSNPSLCNIFKIVTNCGMTEIKKGTEKSVQIFECDKSSFINYLYELGSRLETIQRGFDMKYFVAKGLLNCSSKSSSHKAAIISKRLNYSYGAYD